MSTRKSSSIRETEKVARLPSVGELERGLSQDIQASYRNLIGSQPRRIVCHLFGNCIGIVIEQSLTAIENLLAEQDDKSLANQVRRKIDDTFRQELFELVEKRLGVKASSVLLETSLESGMTGSLVVLVSLPEVRNLASIPKADTHQKAFKKDRNGS